MKTFSFYESVLSKLELEAMQLEGTVGLSKLKSKRKELHEFYHLSLFLFYFILASCLQQLCFVLSFLPRSAALLLSLTTHCVIRAISSSDQPQITQVVLQNELRRSQPGKFARTEDLKWRYCQAVGSRLFGAGCQICSIPMAYSLQQLSHQAQMTRRYRNSPYHANISACRRIL